MGVDLCVTKEDNTFSVFSCNYGGVPWGLGGPQAGLPTCGKGLRLGGRRQGPRGSSGKRWVAGAEQHGQGAQVWNNSVCAVVGCMALGGLAQCPRPATGLAMWVRL